MGDLEGSNHGYRAYQRAMEASAGFAQMPPPREAEGPVTGPLAGEHPYGEHPSRTLFVRNINSNVEDSELRALFEVGPRNLLVLSVSRFFSLRYWAFTYGRSTLSLGVFEVGAGALDYRFDATAPKLDCHFTSIQLCMFNRYQRIC